MLRRCYIPCISLPHVCTDIIATPFQHISTQSSEQMSETSQHTYSRRIRNHRFSVHHPSSFCLINTNHSSIWWKNYIRLSGLYVLCRESQRTATKTTTTTSADGIEEEKKCIFLLLPFLLTHPEHPNRAGFLLQFHIQIGVTVQRQHFSALLLI